VHDAFHDDVLARMWRLAGGVPRTQIERSDVRGLVPHAHDVGNDPFIGAEHLGKRRDATAAHGAAPRRLLELPHACRTGSHRRANRGDGHVDAVAEQVVAQRRHGQVQRAGFEEPLASAGVELAAVEDKEVHGVRVGPVAPRGETDDRAARCDLQLAPAPLVIAPRQRLDRVREAQVLNRVQIVAEDARGRDHAPVGEMIDRRDRIAAHEATRVLGDDPSARQLVHGFERRKVLPQRRRRAIDLLEGRARDLEHLGRLFGDDGRAPARAVHDRKLAHAAAGFDVTDEASLSLRLTPDGEPPDGDEIERLGVVPLAEQDLARSDRAPPGGDIVHPHARGERRQLLQPRAQLFGPDHEDALAQHVIGLEQRLEGAARDPRQPHDADGADARIPATGAGRE